MLRRAVSHTARPVLLCATHRLALAAQLAPPEKIHRLSASVIQIKMVHVSLSFGVAPETQMQMVHFPHKFGFNRSVRCGLTGRSTGHFAAVRVWLSFHFQPNTARRKVPVSFNVRRHRTRCVDHLRIGCKTPEAFAMWRARRKLAGLLFACINPSSNHLAGQ